MHFGYGALVHIAGSNDGTLLTFTVPDGLTPACFYSNPRCLVATQQTTPGNYSVTVENSMGTSNAHIFVVTGPANTRPSIQSLAPTSGSIGTSVTIHGSGFTSDNTVSFDSSTAVDGVVSQNGTQLTFTVPQYIRPYCPPGAQCFVYQIPTQPATYSVTVKNQNGTSNGVNFTVTE